MTAMRASSTLALAAPLLLAAISARAEVVEGGNDGFTVRQSALTSAAPDTVWSALIDPARWWSPGHSWSGDPANLTLAPVAGGCFCEALPAGGSVEHMRVIHSAPGQMLRLSGALGPLQAEALTGTLTVELATQAEGTRITWTYVVGGHARFPLADIAPTVDSVLAEQLTRLEGFLRRDERL